MATSTQEWIDELKSISVLELSERIRALEEEFGVSATAVAAAAPAGGAGAGAGAGAGSPRGITGAPCCGRASSGRPGGDRSSCHPAGIGGAHPAADWDAYPRSTARCATRARTVAAGGADR